MGSDSRNERKAGESRRRVGRFEGSLAAVDETANAMDGLVRWMRREISEGVAEGLAGETETPRERRAK